MKKCRYPKRYGIAVLEEKQKEDDPRIDGEIYERGKGNDAQTMEWRRKRRVFYLEIIYMGYLIILIRYKL